MQTAIFRTFVPNICSDIRQPQIRFNPQSLIIKMSHLTFCQRIASLRQRKMSFKTLLILLCVKIFLNQFVTNIQFPA